jgi:hypothetical protein
MLLSIGPAWKFLDSLGSILHPGRVSNRAADSLGGCGKLYMCVLINRDDYIKHGISPDWLTFSGLISSIDC